MEQLWAPWRLAYVQEAGAADGCVFCRESAGELGEESLVIHRDAAAQDAVFLNGGQATFGMHPIPGEVVACHGVQPVQAGTDGQKPFYRRILVEIYDRYVPWLWARARRGDADAKKELAALGELGADESSEIHALTVQALAALAAAYAPEGYNVGWNLGAVAGGSISGHLHEHVVPRWSGDTNFMPVLADIKVLPEHLEATRARLTEMWPA